MNQDAVPITVIVTALDYAILDKHTSPGLAVAEAALQIAIDPDQTPFVFLDYMDRNSPKRSAPALAAKITEIQKVIFRKKTP